MFEVGLGTGKGVMARFIWNRQVPLILALIASSALVSVHARPANAQSTREFGVDPMEPGPLPPGVGDPDEPIPGSKSSSRWGQMRGSSTRLQSRAVGDGRAVSSVGLWRLRTVMLGLRAYVLRF